MDLLNDYYPLYPPNPEYEGMSNEEYEERMDYIEGLNKRKADLHYDDWYLKYSEDLWYLWCIINEHTSTNLSPLLCNMEYAHFSTMCFENSQKY